jgi:hypothetical protein
VTVRRLSPLHGLRRSFRKSRWPRATPRGRDPRARDSDSGGRSFVDRGHLRFRFRDSDRSVGFQPARPRPERKGAATPSARSHLPRGACRRRRRGLLDLRSATLGFGGPDPLRPRRHGFRPHELAANRSNLHTERRDRDRQQFRRPEPQPIGSADLYDPCPSRRGPSSSQLTGLELPGAGPTRNAPRTMSGLGSSPRRAARPEPGCPLWRPVRPPIPRRGGPLAGKRSAQTV